MNIISRGFRGRGRDGPPDRVPPGQYLTDDFPVLSAGPTPHTPLEEWTFEIRGARRARALDLGGAPGAAERGGHQGHPLRDQVVEAGHALAGRLGGHAARGCRPRRRYALAFCDGGYTTNLPIEDLTDGKAWVAYNYGGEPLEPEHGGPARLLVPHLYFWKSAKWVRGLQLLDEDEPGFWEQNGYHMRGDPWLEQRYWGD